MKTYVLYHGGCWDGFAAAWIARGVLKGDVTFLPVNYGQPAPDIEPGSRLYILDFSYPREQILNWWLGPQEMHDLILLDHHKTAKESLAGLEQECFDKGLERPKIVFDMDKSGARLAWEHFHGTKLSPPIVDYIEDRDLWRWALPFSREVNAAIRSHQMDFELLDLWAGYTHPDLRLRFLHEGLGILRREAQIVAEHVKHAREKEIGGYRVPAVNATVLSSEIAGELAKGQPFGACYFEGADGKRIWSLRSGENGVDVSEIAKRYGGGGHKHAAGFEEAVC